MGLVSARGKRKRSGDTVFLKPEERESRTRGKEGVSKWGRIDSVFNFLLEVRGRSVLRGTVEI